jgi:GntR family transcriptional regulator
MSTIPSGSSPQHATGQPSSAVGGRIPVARQPGTALYRQVAEDLLARVRRSELTPGQRLAPEAQLAQQYGVNRLTMRRALEELARAGIVRTEHGVGSFIAVPATRHRIDDGAASLSESMARRGIAVRHHVLAVTELDPGPDAPFPDFAGATVQFRFVRYLAEEPWSIGEVTLPASLAPLDWDGRTSVFAAVSARHGLTVKRAERAFSAGPASPDDAGWLDVPVGSPLLEVRGFNTDSSGRAIATVAHRIRGDRAEYVVRLPH